MKESLREAPAAWILASAFWKDKWIILLGLAIGTVFGLAMTMRPEVADQFTSTLSLQVVARFAPYDETFDKFHVQWQQSPIWRGTSDVSVSAKYDNAMKAAIIYLQTSDATGAAVERYKEALQTLVDRFEADAVETARLQLHELAQVRQIPGLEASDYVASTMHQMRLIIADASDDNGLLAINEVTPLAGMQRPNRDAFTIAIAAILGLVAGGLLSMGRMIWSAAGRFSMDEQTEGAPSPRPARNRRSGS